jgi:hypothetical protein
MTKTTWTFVPAGVLGQGSADVRPYPGVVVCPTPVAVQGTGLPAVGFTADVRATGGDVARLRSLNGSVAVLARTHEPATQQSIDQKFAQNDGTILGIHSPGRPQS